MAISRKQALKTLRGRTENIAHHLERICNQPTHSSHGKWIGEVRNWLREMEEVLPHVGKKTTAEWQVHIDAFRADLGD